MTRQPTAKAPVRLPPYDGQCRRATPRGGRRWGLAGLSAGIEAADRGASVVLLERRHRLGGATWSFQRRGVWYDNGQHVFMRCCTAYLAFLKRIGSEDGVFLQKRLNIPVLSPGGRTGSIRRTTGPAPLHLAWALLAYPHLGLRQRLGVLRAGLAIRRLDPDDPALDDTSFGDWLTAHGQDASAIEALWNLIVLPTVNVTAYEASLKLAAKVFVTGLLSKADAADIGWARMPLAALHGDSAQRALEAVGGQIRTRAAVTAVKPGRSKAGERRDHPSRGSAAMADTDADVDADSGDHSGAVTDSAHGSDGNARRLGLAVRVDGEAIDADSVVLAVPHDVAGSLLPPGSVKSQDQLDELGTSPIVNVHLVYDRPVTRLRVAAGVGTDAQFLFDRTEGAGLDDGRQCLAVSLSGADSHIGRPSADLIAQFASEVARLLPAAADAEITDSIVTRERAATFSGQPGTHTLRPGAAISIPGVYLAGAWTDTGWPATMEGAVRSGIIAGRLAARFAEARCAS